ncbi:MAG: polysaccharide pyruvyl transferase family protein, partial [Firmicutes bacterium]|nr:polysaccharide pyruvyl transferase family protein [Bacillota bacterium]
FNRYGFFRCSTSFYNRPYKNIYTDEAIEKINREFDGFILPLADFFREDQTQNISNLTRTIKKLTIPCVVVGVGLRAPYEYDISTDRLFDSAVKAFVSAILERSQCLGVRGERTAAYLKKLGFNQDNYMVIGCPSMCMSAAGKGIQMKEIPRDLRNAKFGIITNDLAPDHTNKILVEVIKQHKDAQVIVQRTTEIIDIYFGTFANLATKFSKRKPESVYGKTLYRELLKTNRIHAFANINQWRKNVNRLDICLNERFHGTVASILAGTPSIIIPIDSRTRELVEYHKIPNIRPEMIQGGGYS